MKVTLFTDGACKGNPGPGGWGAVLQWGKHEKRLCGGVDNTTNNRMELMAAIEGLRALTRPCEVDLWTDSVYVKDGITKWMVNWKANGWRTASKKPVANQDLWQALDVKLDGIKCIGIGSRGMLATPEMNWPINLQIKG